MSTRNGLKWCAAEKGREIVIRQGQAQWLLNQLNKLECYQKNDEWRKSVARTVLNEPLPSHDYLNEPG